MLADVLQGDGLWSDGLHDDALRRWAVRTLNRGYCLSNQSVHKMIMYSRPRSDGPCTTAGIGIIVASTLLVEHTRSGESRGRDGGTYREKGGKLRKIPTNDVVEYRSSAEQRIPMHDDIWYIQLEPHAP